MTQPALFPAPPRRRKQAPAAPEPAPRTGPRPGEALDPADAELGWQYPYVTPRRAQQIRAELDARHTREDTRTDA